MMVVLLVLVVGEIHYFQDRSIVVLFLFFLCRKVGKRRIKGSGDEMSGLMACFRAYFVLP